MKDVFLKVGGVQLLIQFDRTENATGDRQSSPHWNIKLYKSYNHISSQGNNV